MQELLGLELSELASSLGGPAYRATQLFEWIYARNVQDVASMTSLSKLIAPEMSERFTLTLPEVLEVQQSRDGTAKYALNAGGETIEMVHMPEEKRDTLCISSQAGCSFGCKFCVTARMNLRRNLNAGEIVGQVLLAMKSHGRGSSAQHRFHGNGRAASQL